MPSTFRNATLVLALCAAPAACGLRDAEPDARPVSTRTDSAGIEIVYSEVPLAGAPAFAELGSAPSLRLGALDGAEAEQFGAIRALAPLGGGGVAVLDQQAAQILLFDGDGTYLGTLGAKGEGPGELMSPGTLARLPGDTFAVYDARTRRITRFAAAGGDPDVHTLQNGGTGLPILADFFPDGRLAVSLRKISPGAVPPKEGADVVTRDSAAIVVYSARGEPVDTAAVIPNREILLKITRAGQSINVLLTPTAFARSGVFAAHLDGVWAGFGDRWELRLYDAVDGTLRRILRAPGLERPLTEEETDAVHRAATANDTTPEQRERRDVWWAMSPRPEVRPTYDRMLMDDQARLWLREWPGADESVQRWWVFQREGDLLGSVDAPTGVTLMAVAGDGAWGVLRDEFDVQYVVRHPMTVVVR
jgi:hypothetical protein